MNSVLRAPHQFNAAGEKVMLHVGEISLPGEPSEPGRIVLTQVSEPGIEWSLDPPLVNVGIVNRAETSIIVGRPTGNHTVPAYRRDRVSGWLNAVQLGDPTADLAWIMVHWLNMPATCSPDWIIDEEQGVEFNGRWQFSVGPWDLILDRRPDLRETWVAIAETGSIAITHVMEIRRKDRGAFVAADITPLLRTLQYGVSFAVGRWTSPALPVGFDADGRRVWEEWVPLFCDAGARSAVGWWTSGRPDELVELLARLLPRFESDDAFTMRYLLASSIQAGLSGLVEHRVTAAFPAIEHLSWTVLKQRDGRNSKQYKAQFKGGSSRLTELLNRAQIPLAIPQAGLPALAAFAQANHEPSGPLDGPTAVVRVRSKIIHPVGSQVALYQSPGTVQDTWRLTCDYLRLLILWEIGYIGTYQPLTDLTRWSGNTDQVPWANGPR